MTYRATGCSSVGYSVRTRAELSPLFLAGVSGVLALAAIVLRVPGGDVVALGVGLGALAIQSCLPRVWPGG